jgi:hypothetical protein
MPSVIYRDRQTSVKKLRASCYRKPNDEEVVSRTVWNLKGSGDRQNGHHATSLVLSTRFSGRCGSPRGNLLHHTVGAKRLHALEICDHTSQWRSLSMPPAGAPFKHV